MSLGLFNCRLIQPTGDQLFFLSAVLPHRCQFGQALFSLLVARPARPRPAGGRRMLLAFPSQKDFAWFSAGAKSRRMQKSSLPPIHPRISPKIHLTLPIDSAIEPVFKKSLPDPRNRFLKITCLCCANSPPSSDNGSGVTAFR